MTSMFDLAVYFRVKSDVDQQTLGICMFYISVLSFFVAQGMLGPTGKPGRNGEPGKLVRRSSTSFSDLYDKTFFSGRS